MRPCLHAAFVRCFTLLSLCAAGSQDRRVWPRFPADSRLDALAALVAEQLPGGVGRKKVEKWFAAQEPPLLLIPCAEFRLAAHATRRIAIADYTGGTSVISLLWLLFTRSSYVADNNLLAEIAGTVKTMIQPKAKDRQVLLDFDDGAAAATRGWNHPSG